MSLNTTEDCRKFWEKHPDRTPHDMENSYHHQPTRGGIKELKPDLTFVKVYGFFIEYGTPDDAEAMDELINREKEGVKIGQVNRDIHDNAWFWFNKDKIILIVLPGHSVDIERVLIEKVLPDTILKEFQNRMGIIFSPDDPAIRPCQLLYETQHRDCNVVFHYDHKYMKANTYKVEYGKGIMQILPSDQ
jgi:hypothetical protein